MNHIACDQEVMKYCSGRRQKCSALLHVFKQHGRHIACGQLVEQLAVVSEQNPEVSFAEARGVL